MRSVINFLFVLIVFFCGQSLKAQHSYDDVVYQSPVLLTKSMMEQHAQLVQKLLDVTYTSQQKQKHFQLIKDYWVKNDYKGMQNISNNLQYAQQLFSYSEAELLAVIKQVRSALIIDLIEDGKQAEDSRWYLQTYLAAHPPLITGEIPFVKETADALLDCEFFINKELKSMKVTVLSKEQREAAYKDLSAQWLSLDSEKKKTIMRGVSNMGLVAWRWTKMSNLDKIFVKAQYVGEQYLTQAERNAYQKAIAQTNSQLQQLHGQQWELIQNELNFMKQSTDIIMGRGIRWDPSRNRYVQDGGIVTEFW
jgi:hypothetical protein